jgi:predicted restriction endonuclease
LHDQDGSPIIEKSFSGETETLALRKQRRGQSFFRNAVLSAYGQKCCITGIEEPALLRASHIIPWSKSPEERLSPMNGLALNTLHDAAFDDGLMTVDESHRVILSSRLRNVVPDRIFADFFSRFSGSKIFEPERFGPSPENLAYHRANVFQP